MPARKYGTKATRKNWFIYYIIMLQLSPGQQNICITVNSSECKHSRLAFKNCKLKEGVIIQSANATRNDVTRCSYHPSTAEGQSGLYDAYGYEGNVLWVTRHCQLKYRVCFSDTANTLSESTLMTKQPLATSYVTSFSSKIVSSPEKDPMKNTSDWSLNRSHTEEAHNPNSSKEVIVAILVPTLIVVGLAALGTYLSRKRFSQQRSSKELSDTTERPTAQNGESNAYFILEQRTTWSPRQNNEIDSPGPKQHDLQRGRTAVAEGSSEDGVVDSTHTHCLTDDVTDAIQSLPDNEYNVLNSKSKYTCHDPTYHLLQNMQVEKDYFSTNDFPNTVTIESNKKVNTTIDYSHASFDHSQVEAAEGIYDNQYSHLSSM